AKTCDGIVTPEVKIKNKGGNALTSATINYEGNNGAVATYNWTGNLAYLESAQFVLPPTTFNPGTTNTFKVYTTSPNGAVDQNPFNDTITRTIGTAVASTNTVIMLLKLDANPSETSYEVLNSQNQVIDSHGPFSTPNAIVKDTFYVTTGDCYRYIIHDASGNGISGNFYTLRCGSTVVCSGAFTVGSMETAEFGVHPTAGNSISGIVSYPKSTPVPLGGFTLELKDSNGSVVGNATTDATGNYTFTGVQNGTYTISTASTKTWGGVSASDVLLYKKHIAGISLLSGIFLNSGDVNGSGSLSASDVLLIKKRIALITNSFSVGDWLVSDIPVTVNGSSVTLNLDGLCYGDANASYTPPAK
ncbi:MAG TPA: SdrD B-like domain-containing protein, partial [Bacteroidales bacterium]|nr:SdrD B-like domain-containing protein [Bacteroidales bacterium]